MAIKCIQFIIQIMHTWSKTMIKTGQKWNYIIRPSVKHIQKTCFGVNHGTWVVVNLITRTLEQYISHFMYITDCLAQNKNKSTINYTYTSLWTALFEIANAFSGDHNSNPAKTGCLHTVCILERVAGINDESTITCVCRFRQDLFVAD